MSLIKEIQLVHNWLERNNNFYSINSIPKVPFITSLANNNRIIGIIWRQLFRLSPINFRPILNKGFNEKNPKAMILLSLAYLELWNILKNEKFKKQYINYINKVIEIGLQDKYFAIPQLKKLYLKSYQANENDISPLLTALAGFIFIKAYKYLSDGYYLDLAESVGKYFIEELPKIQLKDSLYFHYAPGLKEKIYNANAIISSYLIELSDISQNQIYFEYGRKGIKYTISVQNQDGSWFYGEKKGVKYIDNFHTAFILLALFKSMQYWSNENLTKAFDSGLKYYISNLFKKKEDSLYRPIHFDPRFLPYNSNLIIKVDLRDSALSIILFSLLSKKDIKYFEYAKNILSWTVDNMKNENGYFCELGWFYKNKIPYLEFQAWMFLSLSLYFKYSNNRRKKSEL